MKMSLYKKKKKKKSLQQQIKSLKNENSNFKGDIKTQLKIIENLSRFENRSVKTSRNKSGHSTNTGENSLEGNRKSNDIRFELSNKFPPLHNNDQNLTTKRPTSTGTQENSGYY